VCNENLYLLQYLAATHSQRAPLGEQSTDLALVAVDSSSMTTSSSSSATSTSASAATSTTKKRKKKPATKAEEGGQPPVEREKAQPEVKTQPEMKKQPEAKKQEATTAPPDLKSLFSAPSPANKGKQSKQNKRTESASVKPEDDSNLSALGKVKLKNKKARA